ncbi:hypothetical protein CYMTET_4736 [Cymbomonas tetramitiformis]|uniref:Uncharacterized protein n=1 Tax=Cymbomonas tetramitiformis TaxID=36881 RepID=A0AAE0H0M3_9CHLO|nr:hypothetical protein CYMTET_4736 [Cymbomonas tetramitiformis]
MQDQNYYTSFTINFIGSVSQAAGVTTDRVVIESITASNTAGRRLQGGNSAIRTAVMWTDEDVAAGVSPDSFTIQVMSSPASIFADNDYLSGFSITSWGIYTEGSITVGDAWASSPAHFALATKH